MSRSRLPDVLMLLLAALLVVVPAAAQGQPDPGRFGPSFACPTPRDPLGLLICGSPVLSRRDLELVQTYQALHQQSSATQQPSLRAEAVEFSRSLRAECGVGLATAANAPAAAPSESSSPATACVEHAYARQRDIWLTRLSGAGLQEARRNLADHLALQRDLQQLGLLPQDDPVDGVYGARTRMALLAFQQTMGLPQTGLMGDEDASALLLQVAPRPTGPRPAPFSAPAARTAWDAFRSDALAMGVAASATTAGSCSVILEVRDPDALRTATVESVRDLRQAAPEDGAKLFAAEVEFLRTRLSARAVQALYASEPGVDSCRFDSSAFSTDVFGRDVPQPLFSFQVDRDTEEKVVWTRFDPTNLPRIVSSFAYGSYARDRLGTLAGKEPDAPLKPAIVPAAVPAPTARSKRSSAADQATLPAVAPAAAGAELAHWSGTSSMITRPFHADGSWELRWASGGRFSATLHRLGTDQPHLLALSNTSAESSAFQPEGGDYYIEFDGVDGWSATVVAVGK